MFHVPEAARDTTHPILGTTSADGHNGAFHLDSPEPGWMLAIIASDGDGWEHVSVHAYREQRIEVVGLLGRGSKPGIKSRTPTWKEMCFVKRAFWDGEDEVVQFHPKDSEYVNCHQHTLHLWRPIGVTFPTPDPSMVGPVASTNVPPSASITEPTLQPVAAHDADLRTALAQLIAEWRDRASRNGAIYGSGIVECAHELAARLTGSETVPDRR